ncbi:MAG: hypothetical protein L6407_03995, partial [Candidatus Delongbacteria bacterium]|nr:hypothetical protein [Candidatus Delongbacteria bacterium]
NSFIKNINHSEILPLKNFLRILLEDINDYGTLSDFTLRRISNLSITESKMKESASEINKLRDELGDDYLKKEKSNRKKLKREIIISIENRSI